jgi:hypothetical protein
VFSRREVLRIVEGRCAVPLTTERHAALSVIQVQVWVKEIMDANMRIASDAAPGVGTRDDASAIQGDTIQESSDHEEMKQENQEGHTFFAPMLQRTTRLRDFLGNRGYEIKADELDYLFEAEFIPQQHGAVSQAKVEHVPPQEMHAAPQGPGRKRKSTDEPLAADDKSNNPPVLFPPAFDFNRFWGCFIRSEQLRLHIYPRGTGIPPPGQRQQQRAHALRGVSVDWFGQNVSLIWLSPSAFISTVKMSWAGPKTGKHTPIWLYTIAFKMRQQCQTPSTCSFHIYYVESFRKYKRRNTLSSPYLPLALFHQILPPLPADFFTSIEIAEGANIGCGCCFYSHALSAVMPAADAALPPLNAKNYQEYTEVRFASKIDNFELEAILDHPFHPYVRVAFDQFDETSLDPEDFNYLLRHASDHIRHLKAPKFLIKFRPSLFGDESFSANPRLETLTIDWTNLRGSLVHSHRDYLNNTNVSPDLLKGIAQNPNFQRLNLRFDAPIYIIRGKMVHFFINTSVSTLLKKIIPNHPSFKELTVEAKLTPQDGFCSSGRRLDIFVSSSKSFPSSLSHLSFQWIEGNLKPPVSSAAWDSHVIPRLAMNWLFHQTHAEQCHEAPTWALSKKAAHQIKRTGVQPASSLLALQIRAINEGILYRKTTEQRPHDTSTTNASVIAALLRQAVGEMVPAS